MRKIIIYALAVLTALIVTPPLHNYAQANRIKPGIGGEVLLVMAAVLLVVYVFLKVWQIIEKRKGGNEE